MSDLSISTSGVSAVTEWIKYKLGYPVVTIELQDKHLEYAFNEAVERYSSFITDWAIDSHFANSLGLPSAQDFTRRWVSLDFGFAKSFSRAYSTQTGVGGDIPVYKDYFTLTGDTQNYEIQSGRTITEIMWKEPAAMVNYPTVGAPVSDDYGWVNKEFGWAYYGTSLQYVVPVYFAIQLAAQHELRDRWRKSDYSYILRPTNSGSSEVTVFPPPRTKDNGLRIWYFYWKDDELNKYSGVTEGQYVSDPGTFNMTEIPYSAFNSSAQNWVKNYALAISKEILGRIRSKFASLPIPDAEVTLDGDALLAEAQQDMQDMKEKLIEKLETLKIGNLIENEANVAENINRALSFNPLGIYMG